MFSDHTQRATKRHKQTGFKTLLAE